MTDVFAAAEELLREYTSLCRDFEEEMMVREMMVNAIDPIIPLNEPFTFENREPNDYYISLEVPGIGDRVDLFRAFEVSLLDARACRLVLEHDHSTSATLRVYRNTIQWLAFWSVRYPSEEGRAKFDKELEARTAGLKALKLKAQLKFDFRMMEELENI